MNQIYIYIHDYFMLKSMTAYGRAVLDTSIGRFTFEIQSVNRKFLEINTYIPKELLRYEIDIKKVIAQHLTRGQVNVKVSVDYGDESPLVVKPNIALAKQLKSAWDKIAEELGFDKEAIRLNLFSGVKELLAVEEDIADEGSYQTAIQESLRKALIPFMKMKETEGAALQADILNRLATLKEGIDKIAGLGSGAVSKYREKLKARLEEVVAGCVENDERLLREVAVFADKVDIAEEITRFLCHLNHFDEVIHSNTEGVGKTLEFILQELGREINTIGSKSADIEIGRRVVEIKTGIEQIKEQIQNVE